MSSRVLEAHIQEGLPGIHKPEPGGVTAAFCHQIGELRHWAGTTSFSSDYLTEPDLTPDSATYLTQHSISHPRHRAVASVKHVKFVAQYLAQTRP